MRNIIITRCDVFPADMMLFRRTLSATCNSVDLSMSLVALLYNYRCQLLHTSFRKHHIDTVSLKISKTVGFLLNCVILYPGKFF